MGLVVTGIAPASDIVSTLEAALRAAGFSLDPIQIVAPGDEEDVAPPTGLAGADLAAVLPTGTGVPGLTSGGYSLGSTPSYVRPDLAAERLGDLEIPDDEIDNYLEALDAGRYVVAYFAKAESIDRIETIFRTSGLANVQRF